MATINQIQKGFVLFIDNYIIGAYSGIEKIFIGGTAALIAKNMHNIVRDFCCDPKIKMLGVYNEEAGTLDIDSIYDAYIRPMNDEKISFPLPTNKLVDFGTLKIGKTEVDALYRYIREA